MGVLVDPKLSRPTLRGKVDVEYINRLTGELERALRALNEAIPASVINLPPTGTPVPSGGAAGQVLSKVSGTDFDLAWLDGGGGGGSFTRGATFVNGLNALAPPVNDVYLVVPVACTITAVRLYGGEVSGSCVVDIWRAPVSGSFPLGPGSSICGSSKPTITGGRTHTNTVLTGWARDVAAGSLIGIHLESCSVFSSLVVQIDMEPT